MRTLLFTYFVNDLIRCLVSEAVLPPVADRLAAAWLLWCVIMHVCQVSSGERLQQLGMPDALECQIMWIRHFAKAVGNLLDSVVECGCGCFD